MINNEAYNKGVIDGRISMRYEVQDKIKEILKDLDEFDTTFFDIRILKEAMKNSLNEILDENIKEGNS